MAPTADTVNIQILLMVEKISDTMTLAAGETLNVRFKAPQQLFVISGSAEIRLPLPVFGSICCQQLEPGDWLIPRAEPFFSNVRQYSITSHVQSTLMVVSPKRWHRFRGHLDAATVGLEDALLARVAALRRDVARLGMEAEQRIVHYLFTEQSMDGGSVILKDTFQQLSRKLNLAPPTLSRTLRSLEESGFLKREGRHVQILKGIRRGRKSDR